MVALHTRVRAPEVGWTTGEAFWGIDAADETFFKPAILRFDNDTFIQEFLQIAQTAPTRFNEWRAQEESWREPQRTPLLSDPVREPPFPVPKKLTLYQSAHGRFYLLAASLVCRIPSLPDKILDFRRRENVFFVMRRLVRTQLKTPVDPIDANTYVEYAFVDEAWIPLDQPPRVNSDEERIPLSPVRYTGYQGVQRRMFTGLIPVSRRETYVHAPQFPVVDGDEEDTSLDEAQLLEIEEEDRRLRLLTYLDMRVIQPWREINRTKARIVNLQKDGYRGEIEQNATEIDNLDESSKFKEAERGKLLNQVIEMRNQLQTQSWYALLDLAEFLQNYLPGIWDQDDPGKIKLKTPADIDQKSLPSLYDLLKVIHGNTGVTFQAEDQEIGIEVDFSTQKIEQLRNLLQGKNSEDGTTLAEALEEVLKHKEDLESAKFEYSEMTKEEHTWPEQHFLLCGRNVCDLVDQLESFIEAVLKETVNTQSRIEPTSAPPLPLAKKLSLMAERRLDELKKELSDNEQTSLEKMDEDEGWFVVRCVYERPYCPLGEAEMVISEPTVPFKMASYFDPEAPARPIRITLPIDTSPGGLRKFAKNTAFVMSDTLACQVGQATDITFADMVLSVLPWPFHKDLPDPSAGDCKTSSLTFGKICTLSIPIITICALILLIVIVLLLDYIFKWVPYLIACFQLPGLKAKE